MPTTVNLRDLDEQLVRTAKSQAAKEGKTLKAWLVSVIEEALDGGRLERSSAESGAGQASRGIGGGTKGVGGGRGGRGGVAVEDRASGQGDRPDAGIDLREAGVKPPKCPRCEKPMRDFGPVYWNCEGCKTNYPKD